MKDRLAAINAPISEKDQIVREPSIYLSPLWQLWRPEMPLP